MASRDGNNNIWSAGIAQLLSRSPSFSLSLCFPLPLADCNFTPFRTSSLYLLLLLQLRERENVVVYSFLGFIIVASSSTSSSRSTQAVFNLITLLTPSALFYIYFHRRRRHCNVVRISYKKSTTKTIEQQKRE